uniref:Tetratricopeptide repeat protein 37 isoform X2 n=1 Tax=Petromyzon marinus TaxID=7757 RepID=A0AAJ7TUJ0_PETMA|nr:tetratricopeptide repeat protein 37 isoform X2 [Petromyzon marinus]
MASKEVKVALKAAREAINGKDFKEVLKHCKAVLQADKENYTAWVFIGVAAGELDQPEKAEDSFRRAAHIDPAQPLAWQGLASLCEKTEQPRFKQALPDVYEKLLGIFESDHAKWCDICKKLAETQEAQQRVVEAVRAWVRLYEWKRRQDGVDGTELRTLWGRVTSALARADAAGPAADGGLECAYERLLEMGSEDVAGPEEEKLLVNYITFLSKRAGAEERLRTTCAAALARDGAGRALLERVATVYVGAGDASEAAVRCYERLRAVEPRSAAARVGLALGELREGRLGDARETLREVSAEEPGFLPAWRHLSDVLLRTHDHHGAAAATEHALQLLTKQEAGSVASGAQRRALLRIRAEALTASRPEEAAAIYAELLVEAAVDVDLRVGLADALLKGKQLPEARQIVEELRASNADSVAVLALHGRLALEEGDLALAESRSGAALAMEPENGRLQLQLGLVLWEGGGEGRTDKTKACAHFLKAARCDPFLGDAFLHLGLFYRDVAGDLGRARGCFRRTLELSPAEPRAGAGAVDCSVTLGDEDAALQILTAVTEQAVAGTAQWAWLRLGLYHLRRRDHPRAITCLQSALRAEPRDAVSWECLGEAYLARGAYTAAGKAFARSAELAPGPQSTYSRYQTAAIRQSLGSHAEAARLYQQLLCDDPTHVPALKGLAESHVALARALLADHLDGRAVSHTQEALAALASAVVLRPDFSCLWKLVGDACTALHRLHPSSVSLGVPAILLGPGDGGLPAGTTATVGKRAALELGARCYGRALRLLPGCSGPWHDLGVNYYRQAQHLRQEAARSPSTELAQETAGAAMEVLDKALQSLKKAVMLDSSNHRHWSALGVVAASEGVKNEALAQHAFIKSIQAEQNNVVAWTHLGALYLGKGSMELAHEAFKVAQSLEPSYVASWIGQALIAETIGSDEAMDLFRHTTELGVHVEGALGYVHWVCTTLRQQRPGHGGGTATAAAPVLYSVERMGAVPSAHQAACKYIERYPDDAVALTMLGLLSEHLDLHRQAVDAYHRALEVIRSSGEQEKLNWALRNYGRALHAAGRYGEAAATFRAASPVPAHFDDTAGLALALFKLGKLEESYAAYERALAAAASDADRSLVLTALAAVEFRRGRHDAAKTLLFRCSLSKEPCEEGLLALCALGLALGDPTLSAAALSELAKPRVSAGRGGVARGARAGRGAARASRVSLLTVALLALRGDGVAVQRQASKAVHRNPGDASLWEFLARVVPQFTPNKAKGGATAAQVATILDFSIAKRAPRYHAVNLLAGGSGLRGLKASQRAVHLYPDDAAGWACVLAASHADAVRRWADATAPRPRPGLSDAVLDIVATRVNSGEVEAGLHDLGGWVHCQAASAELWEGRNKAALRACFKGLDSLGDDDGARLTLSFVAALVRFCEALTSGGRSWGGALEDLRSATLDTATPYAWQALAGVYLRAGRALAAEVCYRHGLQVAARVGDFSGKVSSLLRLAHLAVVIVAAGVKEERWAPLAQEALATLAKAAPGEAVTRLLQGALPFCMNPGARQTRKALERAARGAGIEASIARCLLVRHLLLKSDDHLLQILLEDVKTCGDTRTLALHARLSAGS